MNPDIDSALGIDKNILKRNCSACKGSGIIKMDMGFLPSIKSPCDAYNGTGFSPKAWDVKINRLSLPEVVTLTIDTVSPARRALDLLLARETLDAHVLGFEVARTIGVEQARGFLTYFARFDLGLILELCWRIGATLEDERIQTIVKFVQDLQNQYGLWEYTNPQASRWVTFDLLRSLSHLDEKGDWISLEPRTSFEGYSRIQKRY